LFARCAVTRLDSHSGHGDHFFGLASLLERFPRARAVATPEGKFSSMFEPIHGSAFDITGKGVANPIGASWTGALLLDHLGEKKAAARLLSAIEAVVADKANHCPDFPASRSTVPDLIIHGPLVVAPRSSYRRRFPARAVRGPLARQQSVRSSIRRATQREALAPCPNRIRRKARVLCA
jgi:hypothetical protein